MSTPYHEIAGLDCSDVIRSVDFGNGDIKSDSYRVPREDKAGGVVHAGRDPREVRAKGRFWEDDDLEDYLQVVNQAQEGDEVYPIRSDRCMYIGTASAGMTSAMPVAHPTTGADVNYCETDCKVVCKEPYAYGAEEGLEFTEGLTLPQTVSLTNSGHIPGTLDYLFLSGGYASGYYTKDVELIFNGKPLRLINQMMIGDSFKLDRFGHVEHKLETDFRMPYTALQRSVGGSAYCDYGASGSLAYQALFLNYSSKFIMQFHGPLPIDADGEPELKFTVTQKAGNPKAYYYLSPALTDGVEIDQDIALGENTIFIPDVQGKGFVAFGIVCDSESQITISEISGTVRRYIAEREMPTVDAGEAFDITVQDGEWSSHIADLQIVYRDGYYT